ncbi:MAG TPA: hypothetical protein ENO10_01225, partial [Salinimicrobium catena]|nr:hypothetical protein [Salinimicrobium catena]
MKKVKTFFEFYINSSIHVALAVVSLCVVTFLEYEIPIDLNLLGFVFFGAVTGYNFVKYAPIAKLHHRSLAKRLKFIQFFSFCCFVLLLWFTFQVDLEIVIWAAFFGLLTLFYAMPVFSKRRNLRSISGVKVFIISLVWAGVTVILPVLSGKVEMDQNVPVDFLQRFLFVLVLILPFEIRDLKYDLEQLGTIPQKVGVTYTKILGLVLLAVILLLEFLKAPFSGNSFGALLVTAMVTGVLVWMARERQSKYFASF